LASQQFGQAFADALHYRLQLVFGGGVDSLECQFVRLVADVNPIKKQHMKVNVQIQR